MKFKTIMTLVTALLSFSAIFPTAAADAQFSDEAREVGPKYLDITTVSIRHDAERVYFTIQVFDLGSAQPVLTDDAVYRFRVSFFDPNAGPQFVQGHISVANAPGTGTSGFVVGAAADQSGGVAPTMAVDTATSTVTLGYARDTNSPRYRMEDVLIQNIVVSTSVRDSPPIPFTLNAYDDVDFAGAGQGWAYFVGNN